MSNNAWVGKRVQLVRCDDPWTRLEPGEKGTITFVDSLGTVHVRWDNGSTLGMVAGQDEWDWLPHDVTTREGGRYSNGQEAPYAKGLHWAQCSCGWTSGGIGLRWDQLCNMVDTHKAEQRQMELFSRSEGPQQRRLR
jgi:hypothetical protein